MRNYFLFTLIILATTSCYRMPEEGEVSMIPNVNNPNFTKSKSPTPVMPGVEY
jgi:hypothetical protein